MIVSMHGTSRLTREEAEEIDPNVKYKIELYKW